MKYVTASQLALAYSRMHPEEFSGTYDRQDHERICQNWLDRGEKGYSLGRNWYGKMTRAMLAALQIKPIPRNLTQLREVLSIRAGFATSSEVSPEKKCPPRI
jgi:hypothetical protein